MAVETLRRCLAVLEVTLDLGPRWRGGHLDRLRDERHSALAAAWKERLERWGWSAWVEVSYSRYGERGRVDLVAWFPPLRILVIGEVKTEVVDLQELLGGLDAKARLGPVIAAQLGVGRAARCVPLLIIAEGSTNRDRVRRFSALFTGFACRGRAAVGWLRRPGSPSDVVAAGSAPGPRAERGVRRGPGLLVFSDLRSANDSRVKRVGSHRVRLETSTVSVDRRRSTGGRPPRAT